MPNPDPNQPPPVAVVNERTNDRRTVTAEEAERLAAGGWRRIGPATAEPEADRDGEDGGE